MAGLGAALNTGNVGPRRHGRGLRLRRGRRRGDRRRRPRRRDARSSRSTSTTRKLAWAQEFGATHVVNSRETDPVEAVRALTGGFGADVVIEAVGLPQVYEQAFYARDLAGTVVLVGVPRPDMTLTCRSWRSSAGAVRSSPAGTATACPPGTSRLLIDLYLQGRLPLDRFVSETGTLSDVEAAFHEMEAGSVLRHGDRPVTHISVMYRSQPCRR